MKDKILSAYQVPKYAWISAPIVAFAGIAINIAVGGNLGENIGIAGCILSSFIILGIAILKPKHDLVSLLTPLFAIIIFNPWSEFNRGLLMQTLFAATIVVIAVRLEKRYSH